MILVVALLFLGPERLPSAARDIGRALAKFRNMTAGVQSEFRDALQADELRESIDQVRSVLDIKKNIVSEVAGIATGLRSELTSPFTAGDAPFSTQPIDKTVEGQPSAEGSLDSVSSEAVGVPTPLIPPPDGIFADDLPTPHPMAMNMSIPAPMPGGTDVLSRRGYGASALAFSAAPKIQAVTSPPDGAQSQDPDRVNAP
jgi:sec-independent protein translocase protein TatB